MLYIWRCFSHNKWFTLKWLTYVQHLQLGIRPRVEWAPVHEEVQSEMVLHVFHGMDLKETANCSFWKLFGQMHNDKRGKMDAACKWLLAATSTASSTVSGTTLLKNSRHRQSFHGVSIEEFQACLVFFFEISPWNLLTIALAQPYFLLFFPPWVFTRTGRALSPLSRRWVWRFPRAINLLWYICPCLGTFGLLHVWIWIFFAIRNFHALQSSTKSRAVTYGATRRCAALPVPVGLDCSHAKSAGDTNTPACKARARRHINIM